MEYIGKGEYPQFHFQEAKYEFDSSQFTIVFKLLLFGPDVKK